MNSYHSVTYWSLFDDDGCCDGDGVYGDPEMGKVHLRMLVNYSIAEFRCHLSFLNNVVVLVVGGDDGDSVVGY